MRYKLRSITESLDIAKDLSYNEYFSLLKSMYDWLVENNLRNKVPNTASIRLSASDMSDGDMSIVNDTREFVELSRPELLDEFDELFK